MNRAAANPAAPPPARVCALWFDAKGKDRVANEVQPGDVSQLGEHELVWVDVHAHDRGDVEKVVRGLALEVPEIAPLFEDDAEPLSIRGDCYAARAIAPCWDDEAAELVPSPWLLIVGPNVVVTAHKGGIRFLEKIQTNHDPESHVGELDADSFAVVLLDRMLTAYFDALDAFEAHLDKLEVDVLENRLHDTHVPHLRKLRRAAAEFRRMLGAHRALFDALRRPDFRPDREDRADARFRAVANRYERAMDAAENARALVVGSYELLETRLSQRTNDTMRMLTFATVLLGGLAVVAGVLGMNFQAGLFETGSKGFWVTVGLMAMTVVAAIGIAWRRGWWK